MASVSLSVPGTVVSDNTVGTVAWIPTGATLLADLAASDNSWALAALNNTTSRYLRASNWGFTVPTNSVITGIAVAVEKSLTTVGAPNVIDNRVHLVRRGTILSAADNKASAIAWTGTDATTTYGGDGDLWGGPWTASDINAWDFAVVISAVENAGVVATARIDLITITIYYSPGYVASPQVQTEAEILLGGMRYPIAHDRVNRPGRVQTTLATAFPPKIVQNEDYGRSSNPVMSSFSQDDFSGGMGVWKHRYDDKGNRLTGDRYWTGQNFNGFWKGAATLGPSMGSIGTPDSEYYGADGLAVLGDALVGVWQPLTTHFYRYTGGAWSANLGLGSGDPTQSVVFAGSLFWANCADIKDHAFSGYSYQTSSGAAPTNVGDVNVVSFAVWDNKLYALDASFILHVSTTGLAGSWQTLAAIAAVDTTPTLKYGELLVYEDASGDPAIWAHTHNGLYIYDAENNKWFPSRFQLVYFRNAQGYFSGHRAVVYRQSMIIARGQQTLYELTMNGGVLNVAGVNLGEPDGVTTDYGGLILNLVASGTILFAKVEGGTPAVLTNGTSLLARTTQGWHPLYSDGGGRYGYTGLAVGTDGSNNWLYFSTTDPTGVTNAPIVRTDTDLLSLHPLFSTTSLYAASGNVETSVDDGGYPSQVKTAQQVRIKVSGATSTETVQVAYRIDDSTGAYTNLGSPVAVAEEARIPFGTSKVGLAFKSIQYKLSFVRGGTAALAPKLAYIETDLIRNPEVQRGYTVPVALEKDYDGKTPQQMLDAIMAAMAADTFLTFAWQDDAGNTRSSLVKVLKFDGEENTGWQPGGTYSVSAFGNQLGPVYTLQMVEIGPN